jgi:hypothetical protein
VGGRRATAPLIRTERAPITSHSLSPAIQALWTFASDALAAGVGVFELGRIMGTSVRMIERHYGALLDGAGAGIAGRLDALDERHDQVAAESSEEV